MKIVIVVKRFKNSVDEKNAIKSKAISMKLEF